ncbi:hypothetical protein JB92DRAFT_2862906 [Gautieria morchelliformis]|nr:hypothetical protein JB92DRAFT_2862906 [Gautieria morchelliformis]
MVHSAIKRQRSYILESEGTSSTVRLDQVEQDPGSCENIYTDTNSYSPDDPQALLQALLTFLSDGELASLIITRLSKAQARKAPLYLTTLCIEGVHDFFRPLMPATDSVQKSGLELPDDKSSSNPFGRMTMTRRDSERLTGKFNIPSSRKNSPGLLKSLATFLSLLEPAELRIVIQKRTTDSVFPHKPIACFLEFLQSGGDDISWGHIRTHMKRANDKAKKKERRKLAAEQAESSTTIPPAAMSSVDAEASGMQQGSSLPDPMTVEPDHSFSENELEDGEISHQVDSDPPRNSAPCHSPTALSSVQGPMVVPLENPTLGSTAVPRPKKRRRKKSRKSRVLS